jgi:hypothetical protein
MLHGLGAVAAIRLAPTRTGTLIVRPVRVRGECLSVDNRNDQHRGKYGGNDRFILHLLFKCLKTLRSDFRI